MINFQKNFTQLLQELLEVPATQALLKLREEMWAKFKGYDHQAFVLLRQSQYDTARINELERRLNELTNVKIKIWKQDPAAFNLEKNKAWDACYDIRASKDITIPGGDRGMVETGLVISVPSHCEVQIRPRSGISANVSKPRKLFSYADGEKGEYEEEFPKNLTIHLGTCDAGYRNTYKVIVENGNSSDILIRRGDKIAQIAVRTKPDTEEEYVDSFDKLPPDDGRGTNGFSSSGV